jgi:multiple sugar transport system substrate-binding protein
MKPYFTMSSISLRKLLTTLLLLISIAASNCFAQDRILRFATWDNDEVLAVQRKIAARFEATHPGVTVQVEAYGTGFATKIAAAFGAKNPPDVTYMWDFPSYYLSLEPLDSWLAKDASFNIADVLPGLMNYNQFAGKTYGLPAGFTTNAMYYNKDMFDQAGLAYPKENWTWDDLAAIAKRLRNRGKKQYGFAFLNSQDPYDFQSYLWGAGTSMISSDGRRTSGFINSKTAKQLLTMMAAMITKDDVAYLGTGESQMTRELFLSDKLAMIDGGAWLKGDFKKANKRFGIVSLPSFQGMPVKSVISNSSVAMAKDSKNKDLAWEFIKFYVSPEAVSMRSHTDLPVLLSVAQAANFLDDPLTKPFYDAMKFNDEKPAFMLNPRWPRAQDRIKLGIQQVFTYRTGIDEILDKTALQAEHHLRER